MEHLGHALPGGAEVHQAGVEVDTEKGSDYAKEVCEKARI